GNGLVMTRSFDADYRITGIITQSTTATVQNLSLGCDAKGNATSITDRLTPANSQTFTYDALNRLATASGAYGTVSYTYDADSNRLTSTRGGVTQTYPYSSPPAQLLSVSGSSGTRSPTYTANGDIATDSRSAQAATYPSPNRDRLKQVVIRGGST